MRVAAVAAGAGGAPIVRIGGRAEAIPLADHVADVVGLFFVLQADVPASSVSGLLSWYSTIHLAPAELDEMLAAFRRLLTPSGVLVLGFFDSDDDVTDFDHAVTTAYRWPCEVFHHRLAEAGFTELERLRHQLAERPDRRYAAMAARAS